MLTEARRVAARKFTGMRVDGSDGVDAIGGHGCRRQP